MHADFPLFPLPVVAHPVARLPLQIFEPRYLDLVKRSTAAQQCFGIVTLKNPQASAPVTDAGDANTGISAVLPLGTAVKIVDFNQLPNGLLGIVCEGQYKFRLHDCANGEDKLLRGTIETLPQEQECALAEPFLELVAVAESLLDHVYARSLGYGQSLDAAFLEQHAVQLSWLLSSLLPVDDGLKYRWLEMDSVDRRLESIMDTVNRLQREA